MSGERVAFRLNGEERQATSGTRLLDVLRELGIDAARVAIERNREVVPRAQHESLVIEEGDAFEVVRFVGGG